VLQFLLEHAVQADEAPEDEKLPLLLKLHADMSRSTQSSLQSGQHMASSLLSTMHSNSLLHLVHLYSYMGILRVPLTIFSYPGFQ
jgi:hypothetical protein